MSRVYDEIVDFIAGGSSPHDVATFQPSDQARERVIHLIEQSKLSQLSQDESAELDHYLELEHLMRLAKARARQRMGHK